MDKNDSIDNNQLPEIEKGDDIIEPSPLSVEEICVQVFNRIDELMQEFSLKTPGKASFCIIWILINLNYFILFNKRNNPILCIHHTLVY